ncbi:RNA-directed DNA polymerase [Arachis hypogaea]|uniref:RNA-directed DNA polymerase n=1 Tax=Arachis hypogaea TaxID=3818 RepID=A0A6B9V5R9_ARAHY|nr:RNA-directed DNA polymerase [Arachis hypogaea]
MIGRKFSWHRRGPSSLGRKFSWPRNLIELLLTMLGYLFFSEAYTKILNRMLSDHCPILVMCKGYPQVKGHRPIRFQAPWSTHPAYKDVVHQYWAKVSSGIHNKLVEVQQSYLDFNSNYASTIISSYVSKPS